MQSRNYIVAAALVSLPTIALATPTSLEIDINALTARASGPLSEEFTGTLRLTNTAQEPDSNAQILDVLIDGVRQHTGGALNNEFSLTLDLTFELGSITEGSMLLEVDQGASENAYAAQSVNLQGGSIIGIGAGIFAIGGQTELGTFDDSLGTLLGVDISPWGQAEPVQGNFAIFGLQPDGQGFDTNADLDVFVLTPAPSGVAALGMGGLIFAGRRRR